MLVFVQATNAAGRFFRAGLEFTSEGRVIDLSALTEEQRAQLKVEPNIGLREATEDEVAAFKADRAEGTALFEALAEVIPSLPAAAFGHDGPKVGEVRKAMPDFPSKSISKEAVQQVFNGLVSGGFTPPEAA